MSNESVNYGDFLERAETLFGEKLDKRSDAAREQIINRAWEQCAWISTLTDEKIVDALEYQAGRQA